MTLSNFLGTCCVLIILCCLGLVACKQGAGRLDTGDSQSSTLALDSSTKTSASTERSVPIKLGRLDDVNNPYSADYTKYDIMAWRELSLAMPGVSNSKPVSNESKPGLKSQKFNVYLDGEGWLLPKIQQMLRIEEARSAGRLSKEALEGLEHHVVTIAVSDSEYAEYRAGIDRARAPFYPVIPDWLASNVPVGGATVYPNGDVICYGDSRDPLETSDTCCGSWFEQPVYLCASDGTLKWSGEAGVSPWLLYLQLRGQEIPEGRPEFRSDGYVVIRKEGDGVPVVYEYDGTQLSGVDEIRPRDHHYFARLTPSLIRRLHEAQQSL